MSLIDVVGQAFIKSGEKSAAKREIKEKKKEAATAAWIANVKAVEDWEHALTHVIAAKAAGTEAPEWAEPFIKHESGNAKVTAILHEAQKNAALSHVNVDKHSNDYNKALAELAIKDTSYNSDADVDARVDALARIFQAKTSDTRYRETLIKATISYSIHKAKALKH